MSEPRAIGPETTVAEVLARNPAAREVFRVRGIDTCCGGAVKLADAAAIANLPLEDLLAAVASSSSSSSPSPLPSPSPSTSTSPRRLPLASPSTSPGQPIQPDESIRSILARYPRAATVLERHGLMGCGGAGGPDEPLDLFARVHRIDLAQLLAELEEASHDSPPPLSPAEAQAAGPAAAATDGDRPLFRPFLHSALWCTLTLGATFGAANLLEIHFALGPVPSAHNWIHAGFQLFGFVLLSIVGVSYHTLPRFLGRPLHDPGLARRTLWLLVGGLLLVTYGRFAALLPLTVPALGLGAALSFAGVTGWAWVIYATLAAAGTSREPAWRFLRAGTAWWVVAAGLLLSGAIRALVRGDAEAAAPWQEPIYAAALLGATVAWIQGMFLRVGPVFLGLPATRPAPVAAGFWLGQSGTLAVLLANLPGLVGRLGWIEDLGLLLCGTGVVLFAAGVRPFAGDRPSHGPEDPTFGHAVRLAFAASLLFAALAALYALLDLAGRTPSRLVLDGARHALALGFVTLMILAMARRIIPIFTGNPLRLARLGGIGIGLVAVAVVLRQAQVLAVTLGAPRLVAISGISGIVGALGVAFAASSILRTLPARASGTERPAVAPGAVPLIADANVGALVDAHPEALAILIAAGFRPLANPLLRATMARAISLGQACRMHGIALEPLLAELRAACPHGRTGGH